VINERRMDIGTWSLDLSEDTPADIRRQLTLLHTDPANKGFALLVVTDQRVIPTDYPVPANPATTPHPLLGAARYAGVLRTTGNRRTHLEGEGLATLLNDADSLGGYTIDLTDHRVVANAATIVTTLLNGGVLTASNGATVTLEASELRAGTISATTETVRISDLRPVLELLNEKSADVGYVWRVKPSGQVDWGHPNDIWGVYPRVMIGAGLPVVDDTRWTTVRVDDADWGETTGGYLSRVAGDPPHNPGAAYSGRAYTTPNSNYADHYWSPLRVRLIIRVGIRDVDTDQTFTEWSYGGNLQVIALGRAKWDMPLRGTVTLGDGHGPLIPGEPVWLYDQEVGIEGGAADEQLYAGQPVRPVKSELHAVEWPVTDGMGVYLLWVDRTPGFPVQRILDLTDHMAWEDGDTTLEVGVPRKLL